LEYLIEIPGIEIRPEIFEDAVFSRCCLNYSAQVITLRQIMKNCDRPALKEPYIEEFDLSRI
jgi:hypothetical protein